MSAPTDALAAGLVALTEGVRTACNDPADAIRLLSELAVFSVVVQPGAAPIGQAIATTATATAALCRRTAISSLARACAAYQPTSYDDAVAVLDTVAALIDVEAETAADLGDTQSYDALRVLKAKVVADLTARGSNLPRLMTVARSMPLPSLTLAQQLYTDATRSDELIRETDVVHPCFMPTAFTALSS